MPRCNSSKRIFPVGEKLGPESATHVGRHHPHPARIDSKHVAAQDVAHAMAALTAQGQSQPVLPRIVLRHDPAGIEIVGDQPLIEYGKRDRVRRPRKCLGSGISITERNLKGDVAAKLGPDHRLLFYDGCRCPNHVRQRIPIDLNRLDRIAGMLNRIRHYKSDGIADVTHMFDGEDWVRRHHYPHARQFRLARQVTEARNVGPAEHQRNSGRGARPAHVAHAKSRMRMR